jgi:hypothetical protein
LGCTVAARGKRRSRRLPTKAIDEDVGERGSGRQTPKRFGKDWRAFNVWLAPCEIGMMGLLIQDAAFCRQSDGRKCPVEQGVYWAMLILGTDHE